MTDGTQSTTLPVSSSLHDEEEQKVIDHDGENKEDSSGNGKDGSAEDADSSAYPYIKEDLFTSEIFKVEIQNLPKFIGFNDLKKFLVKHGVNPHKVKLIGKQTFAFVTFKNQEERDKAMKVVHGVQWKGRVLSVRLAKPKVDPMQRKRRQEEADDGGEPAPKRQGRNQEQVDSTEPLSTQLANVVTPFWNVPYDEQLDRKEQETVGILQRLSRYLRYVPSCQFISRLLGKNLSYHCPRVWSYSLVSECLQYFHFFNCRPC